MAAYKPVQNESAHLTDKPARSAFKSKKAKKKGTESKRMREPVAYEKSKPNKNAQLKVPVRIVIETLPHAEQRYPTAGDWWTDPDGTWQIRVSALGSWMPEFLVALHELVEMALCKADGVTDQAVTAFDVNWAPTGKTLEPGDDEAAPYHEQHEFAAVVERLMAWHLGVPWVWYEATVDAL